ncbi:heme A synthase [Aeromicrobium sp. Leaf350]|uniref:COX15/CtaA family protein n=1 Tax=Aeromicrobium sp. Leaf350 TaxID=2876565 RepID=UPI001E5615C6|nr:COX15/CtaA family protein [Aeromicrobium sp. Leaf350]
MDQPLWQRLWVTFLRLFDHVERWAWASVVANSVIIFTGGVVRLTGSGLGCPEWPRCTEESFVPHSSLGIHGAIEFGNRLLTYVLVVVAIGTFVAVRRWSGTNRTVRRLATVLALGIPAQAILGGITVLTGLNPWIVSAHLLVSMALVSGSVLLLHRVTARPQGAATGAGHRLALLTYLVAWLAIVLGTVVTGSGPHAGDASTERNGFDPELWSRIHALSVWTLVAVTVVLLVVVRRTRLLVPVATLLGVELAQGLIGYVQYFNDLPIALVAAHLVGAAVLMAAATWVLVRAVDVRKDQPAPQQAASIPV